MKQSDILKNYLKRHRKLYKLASIIRMIWHSKIIVPSGDAKRYPTIIQLPITNKCNARCVMCNIWKTDSTNEMTPNELGNFLEDSIFKKVKSVGINGGEPSLLPDLPDYAEYILNLPNMTSLNIISNGLGTETFLKVAEKIYAKCKKKNVTFHISLSLDGIGEIHDIQRGVRGAFSRTAKTIDLLKQHQNNYCDSFDIGCTVTKINVNHLIELEVFARKKGYNLKYRLGIENKRIGSEKIKDKYSVLDDFPSKQSAKEFFFFLYQNREKFVEKYKYFSIFKFLDDYPHSRRMLGCSWKNDGITLDPMGNVYYCAVASERIGSLRESSGEEIYFAARNLAHRKDIIRNNCATCIHDYSGPPNLFDVLKFLGWWFSERYYGKTYKFMRHFK